MVRLELREGRGSMDTESSTGSNVGGVDTGHSSPDRPQPDGAVQSSVGSPPGPGRCVGAERGKEQARARKFKLPWVVT